MNFKIINQELRTARIGDSISFLAAVLLILLFGYAAASKLNEYQRFIDQMQLAPVPLMKTVAPVLAWAVPQAEVVIVLMLLFERYRNKGLIASFVLLGIFEIYIIVMLLSGLKLPCTCGGLISKLQWHEHLWFNAFFMAVAIAPFCYKRYLKIQPKEYSPRSI